MKKIALCIFLIGVIMFISPLRSYADYPITADEVNEFVVNHFPNQTHTGKYAVFYEHDNFYYFQWSASTDAVNINNTNTGINFYCSTYYRNGSFGAPAFNNNDMSTILYRWLSQNFVSPLGGTVTVNFNGQEIITPDTSEKDGFFAYKDDYTLQFGTYCTENSTLISVDSTDNGYNIPYFSTDIYWFDFSIPFNGATLTYRLSSCYYMKYYGEIHFPPNDNIVEQALFPYLTLYVQKSAQSYARGIRAITTNTPKKIGELMPVSFDSSTDFRSLNRLSLRQLCSALQETTPDLSLEDLFTQITVTAVSVTDHKTHFTQTLDYSSLSGKVTSEEVPTDDKNYPDQTKDPDIINEYFNSMVGYMDGILYGTTFNPPSDKTDTVDMTKLSEISMPDVDLTAPVLEEEPLTWFGSFVEWWYGSPFGLVAIAALTFLIIRTIIW